MAMKFLILTQALGIPTRKQALGENILLRERVQYVLKLDFQGFFFSHSIPKRKGVNCKKTRRDPRRPPEFDILPATGL